MKLALALSAAALPLLLSLLPAGAGAKPKLARCALTSAGNPDYRGPCSFLAEPGGSFTLQPAGRRPFFPEISSVSVYLTGPGAAEVSGMTTAGNNSRWGEARRSRKDRACWDGVDFRICVY